jgi:hypothetical protein
MAPPTGQENGTMDDGAIDGLIDETVEEVAVERSAQPASQSNLKQKTAAGQGSW